MHPMCTQLKGRSRFGSALLAWVLLWLKLLIDNAEGIVGILRGILMFSLTPKKICEKLILYIKSLYKKTGRAMGKGIYYQFNYEKAIEATVWLANEVREISPYRLATILFHADKMHVNKHGRPILGDTYIREDNGLTPVGVYKIIQKDDSLNPEHIEKANESFKVKDLPTPSIIPLRQADLDYFSGTDLECLESATHDYALKSEIVLGNEIRREKCLVKTAPNQAINYACLVEDDNPYRDEILEDMAESSSYVKL